MFHVVTKRKEGPKLSKMSYIDLHIEIGLFVNHFLTLQLFFFLKEREISRLLSVLTQVQVHCADGCFSVIIFCGLKK